MLLEAEQRLGRRDWAQLAQTFGVDLEATAQAAQALRRRREVKCALDLLRLILVYCVCDWSLRLVSAWFFLAGLGSLSDVAVLKRLRHSSPWLGQLIVQLLQQRHVRLTRHAGVHLHLRDATVISQPGSTGTDWRVHLSLDLGHLTIDGLEVTNAQGGETLARFPARPDAIEVADRGYAFPRSLGAILAAGGRLVVRINWQNLPLVWPGKPRWKLGAWLKGCTHPSEAPVEVDTPQGRFPVRLLALPLPPAAAQEARRRARAAARKKRHTVRRETLRAAGFVLLVTNLTAAEWPRERVATLYRWRWQIELAIKRLKSILKLDGLRAQDPALVQTYLFGKLLAALLLEEQPPELAELGDGGSSPTPLVSPWRVLQLGMESLRQVLVSPLSLHRRHLCLAPLRRYLCEPPRHRQQQLAAVRALLVRLCTC